MADPRHRKRHKVFIAALESLQTRLGDLNDVQTEREIAARLACPEAPAARGSDAVRAAAGHLGEQKECMAALLGLASKAHRQLLMRGHFGKPPTQGLLQLRRSARDICQYAGSELRHQGE